jgi:hypothetical protein
MFVLREETAPLHWPVKVSRPLSGGKTDSSGGFTAYFRVLPEAEIEALKDAPDREVLAAILVGWGEDLVDAEQRPLPYSAETRNKLAAVPYLKGAILRAYWDMLAGREAKN